MKTKLILEKGVYAEYTEYSLIKNSLKEIPFKTEFKAMTTLSWHKPHHKDRDGKPYPTICSYYEITFENKRELDYFISYFNENYSKPLKIMSDESCQYFGITK